ncbi:MAG: baseplate J protein [Mesorhizobium sp.]|uniref:baseplate assembly protein n=1 Tax=Mesorhizobium sp. TaxID=1871066 RepID=UPI00121FB68C|nr:baseplate J/gp47 family protein [Mesorhizobium sp.]TIR24030.1 MAG: baseplate J protein [Mesorhizobium sp.]
MPPIDFSTLPAPEVIETLDFEAIVAAMITDVVDRFAAAGVDYDVGNLETDPVKIIFEVAAYREIGLRARINDAAKANLVAFAIGPDLDHLAGFYDVVRLDGETDDALRARTIIAISGRSTAGPEDWYRSAALRASPRVKDVAVYRVGTGPDIRISVLATDNFGEPDAALLAAVDGEVQKNSVRVISDRVTVLSATSTTVNVVADIWLLPSAPITVFDNLESTLRTALATEGGLGFNVTRSWLTAKLQQPGVQKVSLSAPMADAIVDDGAAAKFGTITLTFKGRDR